MSHSRVFVFNNALLGDDDVVEQVQLADYSEEILDQNQFTDSVNWFRAYFGLEQNGNPQFNKEERQIIIKLLEKKLYDIAVLVKNDLEKVIQNKFDVTIINNLSSRLYDTGDFRYVLDDYYILNECDFLKDLKYVNSDDYTLEITSIYDYHY
jgi:hypothetical protein